MCYMYTRARVPKIISRRYYYRPRRRGLIAFSDVPILINNRSFDLLIVFVWYIFEACVW